ncbi:MAG TPA: hypothetical protein DCZ91_15925 [Lachnospiraceae bacterium]|nr:hypothetical protein [Lachnospiraceae bacterium]
MENSVNKINGFTVTAAASYRGELQPKSQPEPQPELLAEHIGEVITLHGSIYKIRKMRGFCFCLLRTARYIVQCVCDKQELMAEMEEEACVRLTAEVVKEERARTGVELHISNIRYLSRPAAPMPVVINQKLVDTSLENILDFRPLTLRNEKERAIFRIQEGILKGCRRFFEEEHFTEIHTPKIVYAGAEGGANIFKLDYFGREAYLAQSPQFYKQMMVGVFERVYEVGPVFRAEKHDTARHLNEYTGVDFEMGYIESFRDIMAAEVRMLQSVMKVLSEKYAYELELLQVRLPDMASGGSDLGKVAVSENGSRQKTGGAEESGEAGKSGEPGETEESGEAGKSGELGETEESGEAENTSKESMVSFIAGKGKTAVPAIRFYEAKRLVAEKRGHESGECHDFEPEEEKLLSEIVRHRFGSDFVFITHYPEAKRPFYVMEDPENPEETLSFDLLFRGLEITTGGQRIHDYRMQLEKMRRRGMHPEAFESYLMMHRHGMPPHGGLGIGLERLTARLLGFENVRLACLFPRDIHRLEP